MRLPLSIIIFLISLSITTAACTWAWETWVKNRLYHCTDDLPLDYLQPGHWVHQPVTVSEVTGSGSMSEPDTIRSGWTERSLIGLWFAFAGGSIVVSLGLAWLPWSMRLRPSPFPEEN
jgi:hypothetical protein